MTEFNISGFICKDTIGDGYFFIRTTEGEHFLLHTTKPAVMEAIKTASNRDFFLVSGEIHTYRERLTLYVNKAVITGNAHKNLVLDYIEQTR